MSFKPIKAKWPSVVIDNKELNMERKYLATAGTLKFKLNQIKSIQSLSYTQLIKDIKNTKRNSNELIEWELERREYTRAMTDQKVEELNAELKQTREQKAETYRQFIHRQVYDLFIYLFHRFMINNHSPMIIIRPLKRIIITMD